VPSPSRTQKRWSPRLRTAGALFGLLGVVAFFDVPTWGIAFLLCGLTLFALGRRWM